MVEISEYHDLILVRETVDPKKYTPLRKMLALMNAITLGRNIRIRKGVRVSIGAVIHRNYLTTLLIYQTFRNAIYAIGEPQTLLFIAKSIGSKRIILPRVYPYTEIDEALSIKEFKDPITNQVTSLMVITPEALEKNLPTILASLKRRSTININAKKLLNKIIDSRGNLGNV